MQTDAGDCQLANQRSGVGVAGTLSTTLPALGTRVPDRVRAGPVVLVGQAVSPTGST